MYRIYKKEIYDEEDASYYNENYSNNNNSNSEEEHNSEDEHSREDEHSSEDKHSSEEEHHDKKEHKDNNDCIRESEFKTSDGLRLSYLYCDKRSKSKCGHYENDCRPAVILLHGIGYDSSYWCCLIKKLCTVANVFALDLPNVDKCHISLLTLESLTQHIVEFADHLDLERVYIVGQDLGALIALNFSIFYNDRVVKIVASGANPQYYPFNGSTWPFPIKPELQQLLTQFLIPGTDTDAIAKLLTGLIDPIDCDSKEILVNQYINAIEQYRIYIPVLQNIDFRSLAVQVTVPVLFTTGTQDPYVPSGATAFLNNTVINSAVVEFYNQGHNFPILNTNIFNKHVFNFLFVKCDPCCTFLDTIKPIKKCKCGCNQDKHKCKCKENGHDCNEKKHDHKEKKREHKEKKHECKCNEKNHEYKEKEHKEEKYDHKEEKHKCKRNEKKHEYKEKYYHKEDEYDHKEDKHDHKEHKYKCHKKYEDEKYDHKDEEKYDHEEKHDHKEEKRKCKCHKDEEKYDHEEKHDHKEEKHKCKCHKKYENNDYYYKYKYTIPCHYT